MHVISIYLQKFTNFNNIEFESNYPKYQTYIQQHFTKPKSPVEFKLLKLLFDSNGLGNIILTDDLRTAKSYNNITLFY